MNILENILNLSPWHQKLVFSNEISSPGKWNCEVQYREINKLLCDIKFLGGGGNKNNSKVLDCGANASGISFEFAKDGYSVTSIESNKLYIKQAKLFQKYKHDIGDSYVDNVTIVNDSLFNAHNYGHFDIILMLGLYYHFRHPQLFLDYCSCLDSKIFIFSTQITYGDDILLRNRCHKYSNNNLMGWEPTLNSFKKILQSSGFNILKFFTTKNVEFTNNAYFVCNKIKNYKFDLDTLSKVCSFSNMWS